MTDRELTARYEADNPIDPAVVEVKSAGGNVARHAFTPHGALVDRLRDESYQDIVAETVNNGELDAYVVTYRTYISPLWLEDTFAYQRSGNESTRHQRKKLVCAQFLDRYGHKFPTHENELYNGLSTNNHEWVYFGCFETDYGSARADVMCNCGTHDLACEVGKTSAEKFLNEGLSQLDSLVVCPYQSHDELEEGGDEYSIYIFQKPDVDLDWDSSIEGQGDAGRA